MFLHVFVTFLLFLCIFMRLCVCALRVALWHALAPCMVHGIGMHVMHHTVIMFIIMFIMFIIMMIVDHLHVHHSLFIDQSLNVD